jgi:hypothetical protein
MSGAVAEQHVRKAIEFFRKYEKSQEQTTTVKGESLAQRTPIGNG